MGIGIRKQTKIQHKIKENNKNESKIIIKIRIKNKNEHNK